MIISSSSHLLLLTEDAANGLIEAAVEVNIENERFAIVSSHCREKLKCRNFTSSFGGRRQRIVLKCVPHVRATRLFFLIQPIRSLLSGVARVDAVAVVLAQAPYRLSLTEQKPSVKVHYVR